ncbi:MAG: NAD-dependent epimerase/dehydratase family protein [Thermoplasmata archaeon]
MTTSFYEGKTVLVTGAAGFLGSHLVDQLRTVGARVVALDLAPAPESWGAFPRPAEGLRFERMDIADEPRLTGLLREERPEVLFHLAAVASPRACARDFTGAYRVNVQGTFDVLRLSSDVPHFVFLSSSAVYGTPRTLPIDEDHPLGGRDPYAVTKILGETLCANYATNYGRKCSIIRNFNAFGPRQDAEYIVPTVIKQALGTGRISIWNAAPVRDLMFVDNTEEAILTIGSQPRAGIFNVGSGRGVRIGELAQLIATQVGVQSPVEDLRKEVGGSPILVADVRRLHDLGWVERIPFEAGLSRTVEWYRG